MDDDWLRPQVEGGFGYGRTWSAWAPSPRPGMGRSLVVRHQDVRFVPVPGQADAYAVEVRGLPLSGSRIWWDGVIWRIAGIGYTSREYYGAREDRDSVLRSMGRFISGETRICAVRSPFLEAQASGPEGGKGDLPRPAERREREEGR